MISATGGNGWPHSEQNLAVDDTWVPQLKQTRPSGALLAEPRLRRVLVLALWAFHRRPRGRRRARGTTTVALRVIGNKEDVPFPRGCVRGSALPVRLAIADSPSLRKRLTSMQTGQMAAASGLPLATPQTRSEYVLLGTRTIRATTYANSR